MSDVFHEVDEAIRQEKLAKFWDENGAYIIAFVVLTIMMTASVSVYKSWNAARQQEQTAAYLNWLDHEQYPALTGETAADMRPDVLAIAKINAAAAHIENGENEQALALYREIHENNKTPRHYRDQALLSMINMDDQTGAEDKLIALREISKDSPYYPLSLLHQALIEYHARGDALNAVITLEKMLALENTAPSLRQKAQQLIRLYQLQGNTDAPE